MKRWTMVVIYRDDRGPDEYEFEELPEAHDLIENELNRYLIDNIVIIHNWNLWKQIVPGESDPAIKKLAQDRQLSAAYDNPENHAPNAYSIKAMISPIVKAYESWQLRRFSRSVLRYSEDKYGAVATAAMLERFEKDDKFPWGICLTPEELCDFLYRRYVLGVKEVLPEYPDEE